MPFICAIPSLSRGSSSSWTPTQVWHCPPRATTEGTAADPEWLLRKHCLSMKMDFSLFPQFSGSFLATELCHWGFRHLTLHSTLGMCINHLSCFSSPNELLGTYSVNEPSHSLRNEWWEIPLGCRCRLKFSIKNICLTGYLIALGNTKKSAKIRRCITRIAPGSFVKWLRTQTLDSDCLDKCPVFAIQNLSDPGPLSKLRMFHCLICNYRVIRVTASSCCHEYMCGMNETVFGA